MARPRFEIARRSLILATAALALPACGDDGSLPPDVRGTIQVVNQSLEFHILTFQDRACGTTIWDLDLLTNDPCTQEGGAGCIAPQHSRQFTVEAGCYDLKAVFADQNANEFVGSDSTLNFIVLAGETATWNADLDRVPGGPE